jgi:hypothetical protein
MVAEHLALVEVVEPLPPSEAVVVAYLLLEEAAVAVPFLAEEVAVEPVWS